MGKENRRISTDLNGHWSTLSDSCSSPRQSDTGLLKNKCKNVLNRCNTCKHVPPVCLHITYKKIITKCVFFLIHMIPEKDVNKHTKNSRVNAITKQENEGFFPCPLRLWKWANRKLFQRPLVFFRCLVGLHHTGFGIYPKRVNNHTCTEFGS